MRLDDACPNMNWDKWKRTEGILERYKIEPIVGIIPDNHDPMFDYECKGDFWETCREWKRKGWVIAQHGLEHRYRTFERKQKYFQLAHERESEFAGIALEEQIEMLKKGYNILSQKGLTPTCFFAPSHTFDSNTVLALKQLGGYKYISDGYALRPYRKAGMLFLPSLFDTPHNFRCGVYTFVCHPNNMDDFGFKKLEVFLNKSGRFFVNADEFMQEYKDEYCKRQGILGKCMEAGIYAIRAVRNIRKG
ncbi:MAG: DUF2334 domain-containing protein [Blautia sp.]|nr:DUF2334 domain-containing protein [Blautia sp.]